MSYGSADLHVESGVLRRFELRGLWEVGRNQKPQQ